MKKDTFPISKLCDACGVSTSAFYDWRQQAQNPPAPSDRQQEEQRLRVHIRAIFKSSDGTYGRPRMTDELRAQGFVVNPKRVARIMRNEGMVGVPKRRFTTTTNSNHNDPVAENLLDRQFSPAAPNQVWAGDITYIRIRGGFVYLSVMLDLFSRRVVGFHVADHVRTELCLEALNQAVLQRDPCRGLMHHSDQGCQYTSGAYQRRLSELGAEVSMSRKGNCWDNAVVESFFGTLKQECLHRQRWASLEQVRTAIHKYILYFYNPKRRHSYNGSLSPNDCETIFFNNNRRVA